MTFKDDKKQGGMKKREVEYVREYEDEEEKDDGIKK